MTNKESKSISSLKEIVKIEIDHIIASDLSRLIDIVNASFMAGTGAVYNQLTDKDSGIMTPQDAINLLSLVQRFNSKTILQAAIVSMFLNITE